jgi:hypothetical protein
MYGGMSMQEENRQDLQRETNKSSYTATFRMGGSVVHVVAPVITEEERMRRLEIIKNVIWNLMNHKV